MIRLGVPMESMVKLEGGHVSIRGRGINYDTGFIPAGQHSRPVFDLAQVKKEIQVIASELHCTAVRISGADPDRIAAAGEFAAAAGLEVWFAPFPCELAPDATREILLASADRAEALRRDGAEVVLVTGCELSLFGAGFVPGETFAQRLPRLYAGDVSAMNAQVSGYLGAVVADARKRFGGKITYASGPWEDVNFDWAPFDFVAVDGYRDAGNHETFPHEIARRFRHGKPVAITEFGCCAYQGAAGRGGMGWAIIDQRSEIPRLDADYVRDEGEQVRYLNDLLGIFDEQGVDSAFWFTFAGFGLPHRDEPRADLDMASYGAVAILDENGTKWRPKEVFHALAAGYARTE
jgi:hypothetical protein